MSTTALFVELVVIGFEVLLCLLLLSFMFVGLPDLPHWWLDTLKAYALLVTGGLFALVYILGIVMDKSAKWVVEDSSLAPLFTFKPDQPSAKQEQIASRRFAYLNRWLRPDKPKSANKDHEDRLANLRRFAYLIAHNGEPMSDLLYVRSKIRILRASLFNIPLCILVASALISIRLIEKQQVAWVALTIVVGVFLAAVLLRFINWVYCYNQWHYGQRLEFFYREQRKKVSRGTDESLSAD